MNPAARFGLDPVVRAQVFNRLVLLAMGALAQAFEPKNLARAWRWMLSNPDAAYKSFFRSHYANFAIADVELLDDLRDRLVRGFYEPEHACKLYFPKSSGILRPYTLLTVEDQIVYQALVNIIADRLHPKVRNRYYVDVFGHLYGGKSSAFFYHRWQNGYRRFNREARAAFALGLDYTASFDLTAFYDSIDHGVLRHFLGRLGLDDEFCQILTKWLSHWTATERRIYLHHGIPQGPLPSGLLSEVVLRYFDENHRCPSQLRYLRYVDDIRLFGRTERDLRLMVTKLDALARMSDFFRRVAKLRSTRSSTLRAS